MMPDLLWKLIFMAVILTVVFHVLGAAGVDVGCLDDFWIPCLADWLGWSV